MISTLIMAMDDHLTAEPLKTTTYALIIATHPQVIDQSVQVATTPMIKKMVAMWLYEEMAY